MPRPKGSRNKPKPLSNVTRETFVRFADEIAALDAEVKSAQGSYREAIKRAEDAGIDKKALKAALKVKSQDRVTRNSHFRALATYLAYLDVPVGHQFGMFDDDDAGDGTDEEGEAAAVAAGPVDESQEPYAGYPA